ncbi:unnamed protein product, partial [marine sediment metagenome]
GVGAPVGYADWGQMVSLPGIGSLVAPVMPVSTGMPYFIREYSLFYSSCPGILLAIR